MVNYTILMKEGNLWQDITHAVVAEKGIPLRMGFSSLRDTQDVGSITLTLHMESLEAAALLGTESKQVKILADGSPIFEGVTYDDSRVDLRLRSDLVYTTVKLKPYSALFSEVLVPSDMIWLDKPILTDSVDSLIPSLFHMLNPDMTIITDVQIDKVLPIVKLDKGASVEGYLTDILYQQGLSYYTDVDVIRIVEPYKERGLVATLPLKDIISRPTIEQAPFVKDELCVVRLPKVEQHLKETVFELNRERYEDSGQPTQYATIEAESYWPTDDAGPTLLDASYQPARESDDVELVHATGLEIDVVAYTETGKVNIVTSELDMRASEASVQLYNPFLQFVSLRNIRVIANQAWFYNWQTHYEEEGALGEPDEIDGLYMVDSADAKAFISRYRAEKNAEKSTIEFQTHHEIEPNSLIEIEGLPYQLLVRYRVEERDLFKYSCIAYSIHDVPSTGRVRVAPKEGPRDGYSPQAVVLYALGDLDGPFDGYDRVADSDNILSDRAYIVGTGSPWSTTPPTPSGDEVIWTITGYYTPPQSWPSDWTEPIRVTGEGAKLIRLHVNPSAIKRTFRNEYEHLTISVQAFTQNLSGAITWNVTDGDWTLISPTEIEISAISVQGERTIVTASIGEYSFFAVIEVITAGDEEPINFGMVTEVPTSTATGGSLKQGDYFLWGATTQTIDGTEYKKGEIYEWNDTWAKSNNGDLVMTLFDSFADLANDVDSTVIGHAVIKKLVAIDAFIKNLKAENVTAGYGNGSTGGFRFRAMSDMDMDGSNSPVFDVMYNDRKVFEVDPESGNVMFGDYETGNGLRWENGTNTLSVKGAGKFTGTIDHEALTTRDVVASQISVNLATKTAYYGQDLYNGLASVGTGTWVNASGSFKSIGFSQIALLSTTEQKAIIVDSSVPNDGELQFVSKYTGSARFIFEARPGMVSSGTVNLYINGVLVSSTHRAAFSGVTVVTVDRNVNEGDVIKMTTSGNEIYFKMYIRGIGIALNMGSRYISIKTTSYYTDRFLSSSPIAVDSNNYMTYNSAEAVIGSLAALTPNRAYPTTSASTISVSGGASKSVTSIMRSSESVTIDTTSGTVYLVTSSQEGVSGYNLSGIITVDTSEASLRTLTVLPKQDNTHSLGSIGLNLYYADLFVSSLVGMISAFASSAAPSGWLECNGQAVSRSTYSKLYSAIGTTFGAGNGSTTFNVPDLRGEFIRGWSHGRGGVDEGRTIGSFQDQAIQAHTHTYHKTTELYSAGDSGYRGSSLDESTANTGATGGAETRPRNIALMYCIKY